MMMPRVRHIVGLTVLVAVIGYFGVWRGYHIVESSLGPVWAVVAAVLGAAGLAVIIVVGVIVIRTMRTMEEVNADKSETDADSS
jgi:hypothetical protein